MVLTKGDRVIKAIPYSANTYCRHGGGKDEVPIGTKGTIIDVISMGIRIKFDNGVTWVVDPTELSPIKVSSWKTEMEG